MEIVYNTEFSRWEVYSDHPVIRAGRPQPCFVSAEREKCEAYIQRVEAHK